MNKYLLPVCAAGLLFSNHSQAAVTISANNSGGAGFNLPANSIVRVAFIPGPQDNVGDPAYAATYARLTGNDFADIRTLVKFLGSDNPDAGSGTSGLSGGTAPSTVLPTGKFTFKAEGISGAYLPQNERLYVFVTDSASLNPSAWAILSNNDSTNGAPDWVAPFNDPTLGGSLTMAMTSSRLNDADDVLRGIVTPGQTSGGTIGLVPVPEPSSIALLGLLGLGFLRRRR
ncbi:MAG: PEP-CTERM sorting domain-containing protein [Verrucomicrobiales bacterium]|nr:PEP-CTERM sorting domain-containing protein [Verrucomicrobiales bacterium]